MTAGVARRIDRAARVIAAPPERLHAALLDPAALETWLAPQGASLVVRELNPFPGGTFRYVLTFSEATGKTSAHTDEIAGRFIEIASPDRVVQELEFAADNPAFAGTMRMAWIFRPAAGGTEVVITAENAPPGIRPEDHVAGLASSLDNLARYLES